VTRALPSQTIAGRDPSRAVTLSPALLLAPMDGYTDRTFRNLVLDLGGAGGALTEFVRISSSVVPVRILRRELGAPGRHALPVGVQLMAAGTEHLPGTVANAEAAGAAWIDLNFGCPVRRVFNKCAGSALLAYPEQIGAIVAAAVAATGLPVTAKLRAGVDDASRLTENLDACAAAGAAAITLHARLRRHGYGEPAQWEWIRHAAAWLHGRHPGVSLVGNGSVATAADAARMFADTGCDAVMVGRGALANPWLFRQAAGGQPATREEALALALRYFDLVLAHGGFDRFKAFIASCTAGGIWDACPQARKELLRERDPAVVRDWLVAEAQAATAGLPVAVVRATASPR
jgi:tRNA-dihydrouridine synthase